MGLYDKTKHSIRFWLLRRLPPCKQTVEVISQSMERPLTLRERVLLKLHVWVCAWCQWYMEHLRLMSESLKKPQFESTILESSDRPQLSVEARERIKRKLSGS
jgi:hypothetical protein